MNNIIRSKGSRMVATLVLAGALATGAINLTHSHQGAKGIVKERMDMMSSIAQQLKLVVQMMRGQQAFDANTVASAAAIIAAHADQIPKKFPKGTGGHPSEATDAVWKNWSEFVRQSADMGTAARALATKGKSAQGKADIISEFKQLASTCSGCHSKFRVKK